MAHAQLLASSCRVSSTRDYHITEGRPYWAVINWRSIKFIYCHDLGVCGYRRGMDW
jgi:hypothetical protein